VVGCGGDDDEGSAATTTTVDSAAAPTETQEEQSDPAVDERIAEEAGLVLEDFPTGWQQNDEQADRKPSECSGVQEARAAASARVPSPRFLHGESTFAESVVYIYADESAASEAFAGLVGRETRTCLGEEIGQRAGEAEEEDLEFGEPTTSRVVIDPLGDERDATRITIPVSAQGIDVDIIADYVLVRVGRGIAAVTFVDTLTAFDEDLKAELTSKVVRRLSAALD
jgi:hypothetical protein